MRAARVWVGVLLWSGCAETDVQIRGFVLEERTAVVGGAGLAVGLRLGDDFEYDATITDEVGRFSVVAPRQDLVVLVIEGEGHLPVAFTGESGIADVFDVPIGQLWAFPEEEAEQWRSDFAGCPGVDEPGMVVGEVRLDTGADPRDANLTPIDLFGFAFLERDGEARRAPCYLDTEGVRYDPEAEYVGRSGRFAFFGVESGLWDFSAGRLLSEQASVVRTSLLYVPEAGAVSKHPALVDL